MLPEHVRKRLEELNRGPLKVIGPNGAEASPLPRRLEPVSLQEALGGRAIARPQGACHLVERPIGQIIPDGDDFLANYRGVMAGGAVCLEAVQPHPELARCLEHDPAELVYLDLETCGLRGMPLFLAGLMTYADGALTVRQLFARDYAEEAAVVAFAAEIVAGRRALVTFNGRAFDWPYLAERAAIHHLPLAPPAEHLDLLHTARRLWRRHLPNCRLQTLETLICRRYRSADIPGSEIPQAYHDFVRTGNARLMHLIAQHNAMDLLTMAELLMCMLTGRHPFDD